MVLGGAAGLAAIALSITRPSASVARGPSAIDRAKVAYADRDFKRAEELLAGAEGPDADILRAKIRRDTGRVAEARDLFAKVLKQDPKNADAVQGLAQTYTALRQDEMAIPFWRRLCDLRPDAYSYRELALAQVRTKDTIGALTSIQKSLELDPAQQDLQVLLAEVAAGRADSATAGSSALAPRSSRRTPMIPDPTSHFPQPTWRRP